MSPPETEPFTTKLTVTNCKHGAAGTGRNGRRYTIYDVEAVTEDGEVTERRLRTFEDLRNELGVLREYVLEPYVVDGEVRNYTIKRRR